MSFVYPGILQYGFPELDLTNKLDEESSLASLFRFSSATLSLYSRRMIKNDIE